MMRGAKGISSVFLIAILLVLPGMGSDSLSPEQKIDYRMAGEIRFVSETGSTHTSILSALENSTEGDVVIIGNGSYKELLDLDIRDLIIRGNSSTDCLIEMYGDGITGLNVSAAGVSIDGISISIRGNHSMGIRVNSDHLRLNGCSLSGIGHYSTIVRVDANGSDLSITGCVFSETGNESNCVNMPGGSGRISLRNSSLKNVGRSSSCIEAVDQADLLIEGCDISSNLTSIGVIDHHSHQTSYDSIYGVIIDGGRNIRLIDCGFGLTRGDPSLEYLIPYPLRTGTFRSEVPHIMNLSIRGCTLDHLRYWSRFIINSVVGLNISDCSGTNPMMCFIDMKNSRDVLINGIEDMNVAASSCEGLEMWDCRIPTLTMNGRGLGIHDNRIFVDDTGYTSRVYMARISGSDLDFRNNSISGVNTGLYISGEDIIAHGNVISTKAYIDTASGIGIYGGHDGITIKDNSISMSTYWIGSVCAGISIIDSQHVDLLNNTILVDGHMCPIQDRQRSIGIWGNGIENCSVRNNSIHVVSKGSSGIFMGHLTFNDIRRSTDNTISGNVIIAEGDFASCIRLYNGSDGNHFLNNSVNIRYGYNASFIHASRSVEERLTFANSSRMGSSGPDVIIDRMYFNIYFPSKSPQGPKITSVGLPVKLASVDTNCRLSVLQRLTSRSEDYEGRDIPDADYSIMSRSLSYSTEYFGGENALDDRGRFGPFEVWDREFSGMNEPVIYNTTASVIINMSTTWNETRDIQMDRDRIEVFYIPDLNIPDIPGGFNAESIDRSQDIRLSWNRVADHCTGYLLQVMGNQSWVDLETVDSQISEFIHSGLPQDTLMTYRIAALNGGIKSEFSSPIQVITGDITPPSAPSGMKIIETYYNGFEIGWNATSDSDLECIRCEVMDSNNREMKLNLSLEPDSQSVSIEGLEPSTGYEVRITMIDDADLSNSTSIEGFTTSGKGIVKLHVLYSSRGPLGGDAAGVSVYMNNNTFENNLGITDLQGNITIENITVPSVFTLRIVPAEKIGVVGKMDGYLPRISDPVTIDNPDMEIHMEMVLEYYDYDPFMSTGSITGIVYFEELGFSSIPAPDCPVLLINAGGSELKSGITNGSGGFYFDGIPLDIDLNILVQPPFDSGGKYAEVLSARFNLTAGKRNVQLTLFLLPINDTEYVYIVDYEPKQVPITKGDPVFIKFSHQLDVIDPSQYLTMEPDIDHQMIQISEDGQGIIIDTDDLEYSTVYRVTVSKEIPFKGNLSMKEDFYFDFWIEKTDDPEGSDNGIVIGVVIILLIAVSIVVMMVYFFRRSNYPEE